MSVFGAASGSREATETSGSSGLLEASPLFFPHLPPSAVGTSLSLVRSFLEHLETSRSNPMLVTRWVSKARATWFLGLSRGPSPQTQGDPAWEEEEEEEEAQLPMLSPFEMHFVQNRPPWLTHVAQGRDLLLPCYEVEPQRAHGP